MQSDDFLSNPMHSAALTVSGNDFSPSYLAAKKSIDDRALNRHVWETLGKGLPQATGPAPANILELGAGIGTMLTRVVDWGLLSDAATYVISDCTQDNLSEARRYLSSWAGQRGHELFWVNRQRGRLRTQNAELSLNFVVADAQALADGADGLGRFHLLIAHAVLDLIDFTILLPKLIARLENQGLAYLTCNFDGETIFLPEWRGEEENEILRRYHATMEARIRGASCTGRRLLTFLQRPDLQRSGTSLMAAGSSDWLIHPRDGAYTTDEAFFLNAIIAMVKDELAHNNEISPSGLSAWAEWRQRQVAAGELTFLARHIDLLARHERPRS